MSRTPVAAFSGKLFDSFNVSRFLAKSHGLFGSFLAGGALVAEWWTPMSDLKNWVLIDAWTLPLAYGGWIALFFFYELVRMKIKLDLDQVRWENRRRRKSQRGPRR